MKPALLPSALLALALSAGSAAAQAPTPKRIMVIKTQRHENVSSLVAAKINNYLTTVLGISSTVTLVETDVLGSDPAPTAAKVVVETDPTLVKADEALADGKAQADKGDHMAATKTLKKAQGYYEKSFEHLENFDKYVDAVLTRALAYFAAGYDDNGEDELARVLAMRPTLLLDKTAPKPALAALARLKALYEGSQTGSIEVEANVPAATVYVNGVLAGSAPLTINGVYRGKHVIRVVANGYEPYATETTVRGKPVTVKARLKADKSGAPAPAVAATAVKSRSPSSPPPRAASSAAASWRSRRGRRRPTTSTASS